MIRLAEMAADRGGAPPELGAVRHEDGVPCVFPCGTPDANLGRVEVEQGAVTVDPRGAVDGEVGAISPEEALRQRAQNIPIGQAQLSPGNDDPRARCVRQRHRRIQIVGDDRQPLTLGQRGGHHRRGRADGKEQRRPVRDQTRDMCGDSLLGRDIERGACRVGQVRAALDEFGASVQAPQFSLRAQRVDITAHGVGRDVQDPGQLVDHDATAELCRFENGRLPVHLGPPACSNEQTV